jgi:AcrR family transcriptional regulator
MIAVEAATATRELTGEKAMRIVEAMRVSVAARGIAGATFDHVAREAGVSRGLLHYYFGSKERLLVEVVRRESEVRFQRLEAAVGGADGVEGVLAALVEGLESFLGEGQDAALMFFEVLTLAPRNPDIASELAAFGQRTRRHLSDALRAKADAGELRLAGEPDTLASFLLALADGIAVRRATEPELDLAPLIAHARSAARALLA